jgi:excisionase family DNA binding protein
MQNILDHATNTTTASSSLLTSAEPERLFTSTEAAEILGIHLWALRRAVKSGAIPSYTPFNSRRLVRLSEVIAFIEASRQGGSNEA